MKVLIRLILTLASARATDLQEWADAVDVTVSRGDQVHEFHFSPSQWDGFHGDQIFHIDWLDSLSYHQTHDYEDQQFWSEVDEDWNSAADYDAPQAFDN